MAGIEKVFTVVTGNDSIQSLTDSKKFSCMAIQVHFTDKNSNFEVPNTYLEIRVHIRFMRMCNLLPCY